MLCHTKNQNNIFQNTKNGIFYNNMAFNILANDYLLEDAYCNYLFCKNKILRNLCDRLSNDER